MKSYYLVCVTLCMFIIQTSRSELKSLTEVIDVGTSRAFGMLYEDPSKKGSVLDMLRLLQDKTGVDNDYLESVFITAADADTLSDLEETTFDIAEAVAFINKIIKHFQKNPNGGRSDQISSDETTETDSENLANKEEL